MRKPHHTSSGPEGARSQAGGRSSRQNHADSKLAALYQDTLEAPIPQDMLRLLEKIGGSADRDH